MISYDFPLKNELTKGYGFLKNIYDKTKPVVVEKSKKIYEKTIEQKVESSINIDDDLLLNYYKSEGLVGEEKLALLQTYSLIKNINFGIISKSGSGKSYAIEKLVKLFPKEFIYNLELSSNTSAFYDYENINKSKIIYIPELQKAMKKNDLVTELLKNITEGKACKRKVRNKEYEINVKPIIFTLAKENNFKFDKEFNRRILTLETSENEDLTERILDYKVKKRNGSNKNYISSKNKKELEKHIKFCFDSNFKFKNEHLEDVVKDIPKTIMARSYSDHLFNLFEASALFNYKDRDIKNNVINVEKEDVDKILELYWNEFIKKIKCS